MASPPAASARQAESKQHTDNKQIGADFYRDERFGYAAVKRVSARTQIWIEPVKRNDGRSRYTGEMGLAMRTRLGSPDSEVLCDGVFNPVVTSCRGLMARGITSPFETHKRLRPKAGLWTI